MLGLVNAVTRSQSPFLEKLQEELHQNKTLTSGISQLSDLRVTSLKQRQ